MRGLWKTAALAAALWMLSGAGMAAEPWADPTLTTTKGLVLWLDATRLPAGWKAHGKPPLAGGAPLDVWYDASGTGMHLTQRLRDAQPRYIAVGDHAAVHFDGKDDHLGLSGAKRSLEQFTLFVVAAPRSNAGGFRAFFAANETGKNDYTTGFTVDMTGEASAALDRVNVEGKGFGGAVNLLRTSHSFGTFHTLAVTCRPGAGVRLYVNGAAAGRRDRAAGTLRLDALTLGARCYSNTQDPPFVSGFLDGDIAEVLLYDRVLNDEEHKAVHDYLAKKHAGLSEALAAPREGVPLRPVANPPPVQMLVPGFSARQLPVDLANINNLRYRQDGKLIALGYNGNVYVLSDSDRDGLEDKVELFWENKGSLRGPIGMALTPPGYKLGKGVFVAAKGKVVLLLDSKNSGKADKEVIVAKGWNAIPHGVDALGVALDKDGNVYFGLGTADYTNGYLIDKDGKARYDLASERGTILKVSPDFRKREVVCTGIRFPVGLAFNRRGDLFATDQEGATWLPNGNPFDELLHILPGRHYGFPPRHPRHLPRVIDEPSVFDYGPQHQSTCGLAFNEPVQGGDIFGPKGWRGDALVTGYSRGKLYRTSLAHTPAGYVAKNHLLACLNMLAVDCCLSPKGDLVVAVHSGAPDWGSGPGGKGKLYKITYSDKQHPQPVLIWAAGPREVRVAFDRPLDPLRLGNVARLAKIEYGDYVRAGDRFESLRPGYATVQQQLAAPRYRLPVLSAAVSADRRTLILTTAPHPRAAHYALTLPGLGRQKPDLSRELPQHPVIDLDYDLCGVEAVWRPRKGEPLSIWLPHLDLSVARAFTAGSAEHDRFWKAVRRPGTLTLRSRLDLSHLLYPATQPGSKLDHTPTSFHAGLLASSTDRFAFDVGALFPVVSSKKEGLQRCSMGVLAEHSAPTKCELKLEKAEGEPTLHLTYQIGIIPTQRPLPLRRFLLPWAAAKRPTNLAAVEVSELKGGSWLRGQQVFFSDEAACARCHQVRGRGGRIGPDLSNLVQRDYASVLKDIREPSAAINPDHLAYMVELKNGKTLTGVLRSGGADQLILGDNTGKEITLKRDQIDSMAPSNVSIMPEGLDKALGPAKLRDLLTFLLKEPLQPAPLEIRGAPPPRKRAEVQAILKKAERPTKPTRKLRILLAAGPKDHGPGEHDYPLWQRRWYNLLSLAENVSVETVNGWPPQRAFDKADVVVFYSNNPGWTADRGKQLDAFLARGGGLVYLHYAVDGHKDADALAKRIGLAWRGGLSRFRHGPLELSFPDKKHPITRGFEKVRFVDESYWKLAPGPGKVHVLATGVEEGQPQPLLWTHGGDKGRVFGCILGHYTWTFDDPLFRILLLRGIAWVGGEPADRLLDLATIGARVAD